MAACASAGVAVCPAQNTFLAPAGASPLGAADVITGNIVDFQQVNGYLRRNAGRGNAHYRSDVSVSRGFPIRERLRVELRADSFNVFNHPNFWLFNSGQILPLWAYLRM